MRFFYDCEFIEDGRTVDLISIGMVSEAGDELYRIVDDDATITRAVEHPWLRENVIPSLPIRLGTPTEVAAGLTWDWNTDDPAWASTAHRTTVADDVRQFLLSHPDVELWADYGAYDHVALAQLFGRMIDLPEGIPMFTNDLRQEMARLGLTDADLGVSVAGTVHNALDDARHLRAQFVAVTAAAYPVRNITGVTE